MKRTLGTLIALCLGMFACSDEVTTPGELILAFQTDMRLPEDTDKVRILITRFGKTEFDSTYEVGTTGAAKIPATLGVVAGSNPSDPIKVSVTAISKGAPQVLREATTTIPQNRIATLRMPLQWLCYGPRSVSGGTPENQVSACPEDQTCVAGACQSQLLDSSLLPDFDSASIFGGGKGDGDGKCFETETLLPATLQSIEPSVVNGRCTVPKPTGDGEKLNVGIKLLEGASTCTDGGCVVPLDRDPEGGWSLEGDKILLPMMACTLHATGKLDVIASVGAPSKTLSLPMCGPWSSTSTLSAPGVTPQDAAELIPDTSGGGDGGVGVDELFVEGIPATVDSVSVFTDGRGPQVFLQGTDQVYYVDENGQVQTLKSSLGARRLTATPNQVVFQTDAGMGFGLLYRAATSALASGATDFYGPNTLPEFLSAVDVEARTQAFWIAGSVPQGCDVSDCGNTTGSYPPINAANSPMDLAVSTSQLVWVSGNGTASITVCPRPTPATGVTSWTCEPKQDVAIGEYVSGSLKLTATHMYFSTNETGLEWCPLSGCTAAARVLPQPAAFPAHIAPIASGVFTAEGQTIKFYDANSAKPTVITTSPGPVTALFADDTYVYFAVSGDAVGSQLWKRDHTKILPATKEP